MKQNKHLQYSMYSESSHWFFSGPGRVRWTEMDAVALTVLQVIFQNVCIAPWFHEYVTREKSICIYDMRMIYNYPISYICTTGQCLIVFPISILYLSHGWTSQAQQAIVMKSCLPSSLLSMVDEGTWPGDGLFVLADANSRPSAAEVAQNYCFLKPVVMKNPMKAQSGE